MELKIEGIEALEKQLEGLVSTENLTDAVNKACLVVEGAARAKAPKKTGDLKRSIESEVTVEGSNVIGYVGTPLEYAPYIEYGTGLFAENGGRTNVPWRYQDDEGEWHTTSGMKPQPFLRPALKENEDKIMDIIKEAIING